MRMILARSIHRMYLVDHMRADVFVWATRNYLVHVRTYILLEEGCAAEVSSMMQLANNMSLDHFCICIQPVKTHS